MKRLLAALFLTAFSTAALADNAETVLKDYRKQAATALAKLNQTLEKATTPLVAGLISSGDSAGAEQLTAQLKSKLAGEPVPTPQASATLLFTQYDQARAKALEPVQKTALSRIDTLLKSSASASKLETVTELGKVRTEIESGLMREKKATGAVPEFWTYHMTPNDPNSGGIVELNPNGTFVLTNTPPGKWTQSKIDYLITVTLPDNVTWTITLNGDGTAFLDRPEAGRRYLRVRK